jgi:hypothetical protein
MVGRPIPDIRETESLMKIAIQLTAGGREPLPIPHYRPRTLTGSRRREQNAPVSKKGDAMNRAAALLVLMLVSGAAFGQVQVTSVPALDEGGLVALIALIGVVGGIVARHHKKK